jgi:hypothetical protein
MFIVFDYVCPHCERTEELFVDALEKDHQFCHVCANGDTPGQKPMIRLPAGTRTHFRFADGRLKR